MEEKFNKEMEILEKLLEILKIEKPQWSKIKKIAVKSITNRVDQAEKSLPRIEKKPKEIPHWHINKGE